MIYGVTFLQDVRIIPVPPSAVKLGDDGVNMLIYHKGEKTAIIQQMKDSLDKDGIQYTLDLTCTDQEFLQALQEWVKPESPKIPNKTS